MTFSKEIFLVNTKTYRPIILRYSSKKLFDLMLARIQKWEANGKPIHILEVRNPMGRR